VRSEDLDERDFRLKMAERAIFELRTRVNDLAHSLGVLMGQAEPARNEPFHIEASHVPEFFTGFYPCEADTDGCLFRWTGNAEFFELRLNIDRNREWKFLILVRFPEPLRADATLRAFADYIPISVEVDREGGIVTGVVPRQPFSNQLCLTFHCDSTFVPSDIDPKSQDRRRLSLSFYRASFTPLEINTDELKTADVDAHATETSNE
jgi:hypothetical protein